MNLDDRGRKTVKEVIDKRQRGGRHAPHCVIR